jgi:hypothetical protein
MRAAAFASIAVAVLISGPAHAACTKPDIPACAVEKGAFTGEASFDQCRIQMLTYKDAMEKHASCTKEAGSPQAGQASEQELQATLAKFNQRARGE